MTEVEKEPKRKEKKVSITQNIETGGQKWTAEFEGKFTPRDLQKIQRTLSSEFRRLLRRRSVGAAKRRARREEKEQKLLETQKTEGNSDGK